MGLTYVTVALRALKNSRPPYQAEFLVDTGANDSLAPGSALREAGIEPVLGVTALESVGILVDPTNKPLKRLPAIPLK